MSRMKKKDPPKRNDDMPDVIRAVPAKRFIFTDRLKTGISQDDAELVAFLAEIQEQKAHAKGNPDELRMLQREEQEIEQHFRRKEFKDSDSLIILDFKMRVVPINKVNITEDRRTEPFSIKDQEFFVTPHALRTMDCLIEGQDSSRWADAVHYIFDYELFKKEAEGEDHYASHPPSATAHMRAWARRGCDSADAAARAILIRAYSVKDSPATMFEEEIRADLKLLGHEAEERIVRIIKAVHDPGLFRLEKSSE